MADNPAFEMKTISKGDTVTKDQPPAYSSEVTMNEVTTDFNKPETSGASRDEAPRGMYSGSHEDEDDLGLKPAQPVYGNAQSGNPSVWHTGQNTTVVVNQQPAHVVRPGPVVLLDSDVSIPTSCYNCGERITTYLYYDSGSCTWLSCVVLALIGCDLGCCLFPFCFDYFKDVYHKCPECHVVLGKHKRLGC